jgi:Flp pilus assembly protein protease CpaA
VYSVLDVRERRVNNEIIIVGLTVGCTITFLTGHFIQQSWIHLLALVYAVPLSLVLYKSGSIGGADVKVLFTVALLSPGIELGDWSNNILEVVLGFGLQLVIMLIGGYLYWRIKNRENTPPLIPMLLVGYLIAQVLAFF